MEENTGAGGNASATEKSNTAAVSIRSRKRTRKPTKRTAEPTTPAEAAQILQSALRYCQEAGLEIAGYNDSGSLCLIIRGLTEQDGTILVVTSTPESDVTGVPV